MAFIYTLVGLNLEPFLKFQCPIHGLYIFASFSVSLQHTMEGSYGVYILNLTWVGAKTYHLQNHYAKSIWLLCKYYKTIM
jgi:hypothetical protein